MDALSPGHHVRIPQRGERNALQQYSAEAADTKSDDDEEKNVDQYEEARSSG